jgi:hypothetical protein
VSRDWYEKEERTRDLLVSELQRIRRRTAVRPIPVILLAAVLTTFVTYKIATKPRIYMAEVVVAMTEGSMSTSTRSIPFDQLKQYVTGVLLPDKKLLALIEQRKLSRLRKKLGDQFALQEFRETFEVEIWKNGFLYWDEEDDNAAKSARIGITVIDRDPDRALDISHDLASIVIDTYEEQRHKIADLLAQEMKTLKEAVSVRLDDVTNQMHAKEVAQAEAKRDGRYGIAGAYEVDIAALYEEQRRLMAQIASIQQSPDVIADRLTRAGLDTTLTVVEERRPERQEQSMFLLIIVGVVVGLGALVGSAVFLGAFDARIHDTDDVSRLGLPVLGHVPGFAGDHVGSLWTRGALRRRVPSFLRWRFHR